MLVYLYNIIIFINKQYKLPSLCVIKFSISLVFVLGFEGGLGCFIDVSDFDEIVDFLSLSLSSSLISILTTSLFSDIFEFLLSELFDSSLFDDDCCKNCLNLSGPIIK